MRGKPFIKGHKINIGKICSEETRRKISIAQIGKSKPKHTEQWKKDQSERLKKQHREGRRKNIFTPEVRHKMSLSAKNRPPMSAETRQKISNLHKGNKYCLGKKMSEEQKKKYSEMRKKEWENGERKGGWKLSEEQNRKKSDRQKGHKSHFWKGGVTTIHEKMRGCFEYRLWRKSVFERDKYTCIWCGDNRGGNLEADHIKPFALFPALRYMVDNGRTLCIPCHKKTDTWGHKTRDLKLQDHKPSLENKTTRKYE